MAFMKPSSISLTVMSCVVITSKCTILNVLLIQPNQVANKLCLLLLLLLLLYYNILMLYFIHLRQAAAGDLPVYASSYEDSPLHLLT